MKVAIVLLTWQRINNFKLTLQQLLNQDYKDFDIYVSNANLSTNAVAGMEKYVKYYTGKGLRITLSHDGNDTYAFRRFTVGKRLAEDGYDVVMFIDDDVTVPGTYVSKCLLQYEPKSYKSGFAWLLHRKNSCLGQPSPSSLLWDWLLYDRCFYLLRPWTFEGPGIGI